MYKDKHDPRLKEKRREHYYANKEVYILRKNKRKSEMRDYVRKLKESIPCADCGRKYPYYVMQFDHIGKDIKVIEVSYAVGRGSWSKLLSEIDKCEVVCSNCHAKRTYKRRLLV